ncbi:RNA-directed DNA polymerase from mobile element jockey [Eumeta japonica]|uniref:RNA-directed DNA polymerase from mobile element jockey n=1 Tax=Eumeta variegata TaxID=151549 RepID=A0A4C2AAM7_EUMVA|nr:RNA-directed DNA polymerase from mobile element jockey [Eumeta japonica]
MPTDIETYKAIRDNLIDNSINHYTYKLKSERAYRVVIRGLHATEDTTMIKAELNKRDTRTEHLLVTLMARTAVILKIISNITLCHTKQRKFRQHQSKQHKHGETTVAAVYCPPCHSITAEEFEQFFKQLGPVFICGGAWARSDYDKATAFAEHLHEVFTPLTSNDLAKDDEIASYLQSPNLLCFPLKAVKLAEIAGEIKASKKKAPGYDLLDSTLLSNLPKRHNVPGNTFNACLRLCHYPTQWKLAQIVMILKPGKQIEEVSSHRPISLLPLIGKLFERVILNRLRPSFGYHTT